MKPTQPAPRMSTDYVWDLERPEQTQEIFELYDIRKAKYLIVEAPRSVEFIDLEKYSDFFREILDEVRLRDDIDWGDVDTELPVIFGRTAKGKKFLIDGRHRLAKALRSSQEYLPAITLSEEETRQTRILLKEP